ncbi:shikimate dehydrogenase [Lacimicrobium alkaliphilum]|uniref:Shikimate dehydrogenase (NADP(+)) n=1 Tax=Lacimicrobium alkaliphilum TaxID=1526571 RepID=A0ABQ1RN71_9ALTE|nr:shikimate dehydrogenase [Lacimicrobium alkaliphilum]GGD72108.1 shikimate dehydrogenase (NADP(+)) [Lacimicrobium alkaliphilum]
MDQYAVFGNPIAHSKSPFIHTMFAQQTGQLLHYEAILTPLKGFKEKVQQFFGQSGRGANITLPFKQQAYELADELSNAAQLAGSVNTLLYDRGRIRGDNTDGVGLVRDLAFHNISLRQKSILLLGAGGAARGAILPILEQQPDSLHIANRTATKAQELARQFADYGNVSGGGLEQIPADNYALIINASSSGLSGDRPQIPQSLINNDSVCYDMVYGKGMTSFNLWAKKSGAARQLDGLGMLVEQAAQSFYLWRGVMPETQAVREALRQHLFN